MKQGRIKVTAGEWGGRFIEAPSGLATRPTASRVREALFNIVAHEIADSCFADIYAGTGAVGLEALSRGARLAIFIERDRKAVAALRRNIHSLAARERSVLIPEDAHRTDRIVSAMPEPADLLFADPPYATPGTPAADSNLLELIRLPGMLLPGGLFILQAAHGALLPEELELLDSRRYGETALHFFRAPQPEPPSRQAREEEAP